MNTKAKAVAQPPPVLLTAEDKLRIYSPEEVNKLKLLPVSARWLKEQAYKCLIPHTKVAGKIGFRLDHILAISTAGDRDPATRGRRAA